MSSTHRGVRVTRADLAELPEDGYRYEIVDGELFVGAAPSIRHQVVVGNVHVLLRSVCPPDLLVLMAPTAVGLAEDTEVQPDVLVAARSSFTDQDLPEAPLLAVEVLSPGLRSRLTVWHLIDGRFVEVADVTGEDTWTAAAPFSVRVTPARLVE